MTEWSPAQDLALKSVAEWIRNGDDQIFRLFGYAGTGKTTLARHLAEGVDGDVLFAAYTGKAASVLRRRGCVGASTIHSLIYRSSSASRARLRELEAQLAEVLSELASKARAEGREFGSAEADQSRAVMNLREKIEQEKKESGRPSFSLNSDSAVKTAKLVVIDECSMVDEKMGTDLLSFGTKILVLGDPAQLPPVMGGGYFTEARPDVMLTDIHRQATDSPIIRMATDVRSGRRLPLGSYGESRVTSRVGAGEALEADQLIAGMNKTRRATNHRVRDLRSLDGSVPVPGDRLVCLRNNHDKGLLNGTIWHVHAAELIDGMIDVTLESDDNEGLLVDTTCFPDYFERGKEAKIDWWDRERGDEFDFGYCLTCHKAQGSQWRNVIVFDESGVFRKDADRWLYTAITRAEERVTVVRS